jgi:hypothetical protein
MKIDDVKIPLALYAGSWIMTRSIRWGFPYLMQGNPTPNSLAERVKGVYTNFTASKDIYILLFREFFGAIYDWAPATIAFMSYMGGTVQIYNAAPLECYVKLPLLFISAFSFSWIVIIYLPIKGLSSEGPKAIAQLAEMIKPWVTPTAMVEENKADKSMLHVMYKIFFANDYS